jgi:hypothetical protein
MSLLVASKIVVCLRGQVEKLCQVHSIRVLEGPSSLQFIQCLDDVLYNGII